MANKNDIFIRNKLKSLLTANCQSFSNVGLHRSSFGVPFVLLWFSSGTLKWIRSAFLDEPSGHSTSGFLSKARLPIAFLLLPKRRKKAEREEGSMAMRRYTLLMNRSALGHGTSIVAPRTRLCRFAL